MTEPGETPRQFYINEVQDTWTSRATGAEVPIDQLCPYDLMVPQLGFQMMVDSELRRHAHFYGDKGTGVSATSRYDAYTPAGNEALAAGDIREALEAYKYLVADETRRLQGLHFFRSANAIYSEEYMAESLVADLTLRAFEDQLLVAVDESERRAFDPEEYKQYVETIRYREKRIHQLNQLFFFGKSEMFEALTAPQLKDPLLGHEYIDLAATMGDYDTSSWIARELGMTDYRNQPGRLSHLSPRLMPRAQAHIDRADYSYDD